MSSSETLAPEAPLKMPVGTKPRKGKAFWLTFMALVVTVFLSALDLTAVGTALPTITNDLGGANFVWVGSAYALSSTAILPLSGSLADVFGRRPIMLLSIVFFALGSALSGAARNMNMMIVARSTSSVYRPYPCSLPTSSYSRHRGRRNS
jgi:MFS family permease